MEPLATALIGVDRIEAPVSPSARRDAAHLRAGSTCPAVIDLDVLRFLPSLAEDLLIAHGIVVEAVPHLAWVDSC